MEFFTLRRASLTLATVITVGLTGALAPAGVAAAQPAAHSPTWQVVYRKPGFAITGLTATGPANAWASGTNDLHGTPGLLLHWNGSRWRSMSYPGQRTFLIDQIFPLSATDVWFAEYSGIVPTSMLHWKDGKWSSLPLPANAEPLLVLSDKSIWINIQEGGPGTACPEVPHPRAYCVTTAHWNGSTWSNYPLPAFGLVSAGSSSSSDIWVVGDVAYQRSTATFRPAVFRWTGASWRRMPLTGTRMGYTPPIVVYSSRDVYVDEASTAHPSACAMHWNGSRWSPLYLRGSDGACGLFTSDYQHGLWLNAPPGYGYGYIFVHWTGSRFVTAPAFVPASDFAGSLSVAAVPGSKSVWLFGAICTGSGKCVFKGTIVALR